ncbi:hypothetical protein C8J57DRAFT_1281466 [Mycena rebaudengoi]|nr:hypothetical protein C8J57DRAFT_1281466 [Mycena rebaudengoi]
MTEYDYSEEGYQRHLATQSRIATWVDRTQSVPQANPFTPPTPAAGQPQPLPHDSDRGRKRRSSTGKHKTRDAAPPPPMPLRMDPPPRPRTAPPRGDVYGVQVPSYPPNHYNAVASHAVYHPPQPQHRRSSSQAPPAQYPIPPQRPSHNPRARSYSYQQSPPIIVLPPPPTLQQLMQSMPPRPTPVRSNSYPHPPVIPPPYGPQLGYVSAPPRGSEPHREDSRRSSSRSSSRNDGQRSPREQPLLKRMFEGLRGGGSKKDSAKDSGGKRSPRRGDTM